MTSAYFVKQELRDKEKSVIHIDGSQGPIWLEAKMGRI